MNIIGSYTLSSRNNNSYGSLINTTDLPDPTPGNDEHTKGSWVIASGIRYTFQNSDQISVRAAHGLEHGLEHKLAGPSSYDSM